MLKVENAKDELIQSILVTLTNFAVLNECHGEFFPVLHTAYDFIEKKLPAIKLQTLKLLINLSCNEDMVPSLLAAQVGGCGCGCAYNKRRSDLIADRKL